MSSRRRYAEGRGAAENRPRHPDSDASSSSSDFDDGHQSVLPRPRGKAELQSANIYNYDNRDELYSVNSFGSASNGSLPRRRNRSLDSSSNLASEEARSEQFRVIDDINKSSIKQRHAPATSDGRRKTRDHRVFSESEQRPEYNFVFSVDREESIEFLKQMRTEPLARLEHVMHRKDSRFPTASTTFDRLLKMGVDAATCQYVLSLLTTFVRKNANGTLEKVVDSFDSYMAAASSRGPREFSPSPNGALILSTIQTLKIDVNKAGECLIVPIGDFCVLAALSRLDTQVLAVMYQLATRPQPAQLAFQRIFNFLQPDHITSFLKAVNRTGWRMSNPEVLLRKARAVALEEYYATKARAYAKAAAFRTSDREDHEAQHQRQRLNIEDFAEVFSVTKHSNKQQPTQYHDRRRGPSYAAATTSRSHGVSKEKADCGELPLFNLRIRVLEDYPPPRVSHSQARKHHLLFCQAGEEFYAVERSSNWYFCSDQLNDGENRRPPNCGFFPKQKAELVVSTATPTNPSSGESSDHRTRRRPPRSQLISTKDHRSPAASPGASETSHQRQYNSNHVTTLALRQSSTSSRLMVVNVDTETLALRDLLAEAFINDQDNLIHYTRLLRKHALTTEDLRDPALTTQDLTALGLPLGHALRLKRVALRPHISTATQTE